MITQKELKEELFYNKMTGVFYRKKKKGRFKINTKAGSKLGTGHIVIKLNGERYLAHRLAWLYEYGYFPTNSIDHIDHNPCNNNIDNLRDVTHSDNHKNRKLHKNNTSGYNGIYYCNHNEKWKAEIRSNNVKISLGYHNKKIDAINAREKANIKYGFHKNHGK